MLPRRWRQTVRATRCQYSDWQYELWTDERMKRYVDERHPRLAPIFHGFERGIMRADVIRYAVLFDLGGLYCDLDYEFLRPYDFTGTGLVLSKEFDSRYGDGVDQIANYVMASEPGHPFWKDVLEELISNPPRTRSYDDVVYATGPGLLTRIFQRHAARYENVRLTERPVLSPYRLRCQNERQHMLNSMETYGFHHASGAWKERWTLLYLRRRATKFIWGLPSRGKMAA